MFALMLGALVTIMALFFDLGRAYNLHTELQTAVDAAALAGATQLDGGLGARVSAANAAASTLPQNSHLFGNVDGAGVVTYSTTFSCVTDASNPPPCVMANANFEFYVDDAFTIQAENDSEAKYIRVTVQRTVGFSFSGLMYGPTETTPNATAVAGLDTFICGNMVLMMCNPQELAGNEDIYAPFDPTDYFGSGITLKDQGGGSQLVPGEFAYLKTIVCDDPDDPDSCETLSGASALKRSLSTTSNTGVCLGQGVQMQTGNIADAMRYLNYRLDIYWDSSDQANPDYSPAGNYLTGLVPSSPDFPDTCRFNVEGNSVMELDDPVVNPYLGYGRHPFDETTVTFTPEPLEHIGFTRDSCAYPEADGSAPLPNCIFAPPPASGLPTGEQTLPTTPAGGGGIWDFQAFMNYHYAAGNVADYADQSWPGKAGDGRDPFSCLGNCTVKIDPAPGGTVFDVDLDGDGRISRYEMYRFGEDEIAPGGLRAQCHDAPIEPAVDARLLGVGVANCNAITEAGGGIGRGNKPLPLAGGTPAVNIFLTEAAGELDPGAFYGEIVNPQAAPANAAIIIHNRIVLYE